MKWNKVAVQIDTFVVKIKGCLAGFQRTFHDSRGKLDQIGREISDSPDKRDASPVQPLLFDIECDLVPFDYSARVWGHGCDSQTYVPPRLFVPDCTFVRGDSDCTSHFCPQLSAEAPSHRVLRVLNAILAVSPRHSYLFFFFVCSGCGQRWVCVYIPACIYFYNNGLFGCLEDGLLIGLFFCVFQVCVGG